MRQLGLKPYSQAVFKYSLKVRVEPKNVERNKTLDRAMEYSGVVRVELADMLASVNLKVEVLVPCVPTQHTFRGGGLQNFIHHHQDHLEQLENQLGDLIIMTEGLVLELRIQNKAYHQDLRRIERLNSELLVRVMVLEGHQDHLIEIPDSPVPILIPAPGRNLLVEIMDRIDNDVVQAVVEDQVEAGVRRVSREEGGAFRIEGEVFEEGEDMMDVLCWVVARDQEIPRYTQPPDYNAPYIPDRQV